MINKPIYDWTEQDLQELIDNKINESITREYKEKINISQPKNRKELCKDISAIANAFGGRIIFGLAESEDSQHGSIPTDLKPMEDLSLKETMQQILVDGILPRIEFQIFTIESKKYKDYEYVVIDIPQSNRGPHMVVIGKENRFYIRRDFEAKPMTPIEIEGAYKNYLNNEKKIENIFNKVKKENPNKRFGLPQSAYCSVYFIPQYPIENLFMGFNPTSLSNIVIPNVKGDYLVGYNNNFKYSYDGFSYSYKENKLTWRQDIFFRNSCVLFSFSLLQDYSLTKKEEYIYLFMLARTLFLIIQNVSNIYKKCSYLGNVDIITNIEAIDNLKLHIEDIGTSYSSIPGGKFNNRIKTNIERLIENPKLEIKPLLEHFIQSFGIPENQINKFFKYFNEILK